MLSRSEATTPPFNMPKKGTKFMLPRKYAEWIIGPELAATIGNGELQGSDIWNDVCTFAGGWCNDTNVFLAWDAMGRPDESEYMDPNYDMERDPDRRRAIVANARISAMAQLVADTLKEMLVADGYLVKPEGK